MPKSKTRFEIVWAVFEVFGNNVKHAQEKELEHDLYGLFSTQGRADMCAQRISGKDFKRVGDEWHRVANFPSDPDDQYLMIVFIMDIQVDGLDHLCD